MKAILVQRIPTKDISSDNEIFSLAETAGYEITDVITQIKKFPDSKYNIGQGKAHELAELLKNRNDKEIVIFNDQLKSAQVYNLEKLTDTKIIDRVQLILEIFVQHAGTREAILEVELARLQYELPRVKEYVKLKREREMPGFHGPGRYQVDVYLKQIKKRISKIKNELETIKKDRITKRDRRKNLGFLVSLAGYTNSGKSTLLNSLTDNWNGKMVPVDDKLFTTLSTYTRRVSKKYGYNWLITDTVGFIDRIPHMIIAAFHSTLAEITNSDVIVLIIDFSEPFEEIKRKYKTCMKTLSEIGANSIPRVIAPNKIDLIDEKETLNSKYLKFQNTFSQESEPIFISALFQKNLDLLAKKILEKIPATKNIKGEIVIPQKLLTGTLIGKIHRTVHVLETNSDDTAIRVTFEALPEKLRKLRTEIRDEIHINVLNIENKEHIY